MLAAPSLRIYRFAADQCCFATTPVVRPELMPNLQMRNATAEQSYVSRTSARASLKAAHACTDDVVAYANKAELRRRLIKPFRTKTQVTCSLCSSPTPEL